MVAQQSGTSTFLAGNGDGTFSAQTAFLSAYEPTLLATADLNGDGKPDLIVEGVTLTTMLNNAVKPASTVNSASFATPVAVGSIATLFGADLANTQLSTGATLGTDLGGTSVTLTDSAGVTQQCSLFFVSPAQVNYLIPSNAAVGAATLTVQSGDGTVTPGSVTLSAVAPGVYTANGLLAAALQLRVDASGNQTISVLVTANSAGQLVTAPISLDPPSGQVYLILYGTGIRGAQLSQVSVQVGGQKLTPAYAGAAPGYPGEDQINVQLPYSLKGSGATAVTVTVAGQQSNTVQIQVQ